MVIGGGKMGYVYAMNAATGRAALEDAGRASTTATTTTPLLLLEHKLTIKLPYTIEPGSLGGVLTNMAVADGTVYVATVDLPLKDTDAEPRQRRLRGGAPPPGRSRR